MNVTFLTKYIFLMTFWWQFDRVGIYFANMHNIHTMIISVNCRPNYVVCSSVVEKILSSLLWFSYYYHCVMCKFCTKNFTVENLLFTMYLFIRKLCTNRYDQLRSPLRKFAFLSHLCIRMQDWIHKCNTLDPRGNGKFHILLNINTPFKMPNDCRIRGNHIKILR